MGKNIYSILACPRCHGSLSRKGDLFQCKKCKEVLKIRRGIVLNSLYASDDLRLSVKKWDELYKNELKTHTYVKKSIHYRKTYQADTEAQLSEVTSLKGIRYLEIGCGEFFLGQEFASRCKLIIGVDVSEVALVIAKRMLDNRKIHNYLLIQGDIRYMPLKNNCVDVVYGGGVIEHFKDTHSCLLELYRVLKYGGVSFNTVPYLNIGSLTYRQIWGNIPNIPIIKQLAELVHIKLLGARHMKFGYEMSFTKKSLIRLHESVGFKNTVVDKFRVKLELLSLPKSIMPLFSYLADTFSFFWPMVKIIAYKYKK